MTVSPTSPATSAAPSAGIPVSQRAAPRVAISAPYLAGLNPEQKEAVEALDGPVLVLAGAGSGKTRVLTTRLVHLLATGRAKPWQILAVTFTNKAAREMKERVAHMLGPASEGLQWFGTFHSIANQILRRHCELVGLRSSFTILDTDDQIRLIKQVLEAARVDEKRWPARLFAGIVDSWKNRALSPRRVDAHMAKSFADGRAAELYQTYQDRLKTLNCCDFGDLLLHNITIFQQHPDILEDWRGRFRFLMVDEYQDTNTAQYLWLRLLAQGTKNLCVVGDDDQSIYGWRGAEVDNILRFERDFPGAKVVRLERNYRSTAHILGAASGLIAANSGRLGKTLWTEAEGGEKVEVRGVWDGETEARQVSELIEDWRRNGRKYSECAILVRASWQMRAFEERFIQLGLPYRVIGGPRFFERAEIRDAHAWLRLVHQPDDDLAFERVVNNPRRGVGESSLQKLQIFARARGVSLCQAADFHGGADEVRGVARTGLNRFLTDLSRWRKQATSLPLPELAEIVLEESGYVEMLQAEKTPQSQSRLDNLKELVEAMRSFDSLSGYLEHVQLVMDLDRPGADDEVEIMTLHAAKGLEFPLVFLPGWEEQVFPSQRSVDENGIKGLEEERRLAYVGLTRARERAVILFSANRQIYGRWQNVLPSRFIDEIPEAHVEAVSETGFFGQRGPATIAEPAVTGGYDSPGWRRLTENRGQDFAPSGGRTTNGHTFGGRPPILEGRAGRVEAPSGKSTGPKSTGPGGIKIGARVFHIKFGYGRVREIEGDKLTIAFDKAGEKKVLANFVEAA